MAGEVTTKGYVEIADMVRRTVEEAGYTRAKYGFDCATCGVLTAIQKQSPDIAMGVDTGGAGDQGMMFGYARDETPELMPMPIMQAHKLARQLATVRRNGLIPTSARTGRRRSPSSTRMTGRSRIDKVLISAQHSRRRSPEARSSKTSWRR